MSVSRRLFSASEWPYLESFTIVTPARTPPSAVPETSANRIDGTSSPFDNSRVIVPNGISSRAVRSSTATGTLTSADRDTGDAAIDPQTDTAGTYGTFSLGADGAWIYTLANAQDNVQALAAGATATEPELQEFCRARLARFKVPRAVRFIDALPRNPSDKVLKRVLREQATTR